MKNKICIAAGLLILQVANCEILSLATFLILMIAFLLKVAEVEG